MKRTLTVFAAIVVTVFLFDQVARHLLGLDCIGMVLPAWGCVAEPYPTTLGAAGDLSQSLLVYGGMGLGALVLAYVVRDIVFGAAGYLLGKYRPDLVKKLVSEEPPQSYRIR
ncbi:MAG: hypothetical protein E6J29_11775 [Chloroflexi bacterium]|nr:MAG: hypothetical protein E6J29_11775 [Chloroflexota bacterium]